MRKNTIKYLENEDYIFIKKFQNLSLAKIMKKHGMTPQNFYSKNMGYHTLHLLKNFILDELDDLLTKEE